MSQIANQFDWVEFYKELSGKLLTYMGNRQKLIEKVKQIFSSSYLNISEESILRFQLMPLRFLGSWMMI